MWKRILGACLLIAGIAGLAFSIRGLADAGEMATFSAEACRAFGRPFDQPKWLRHWRLGMGVLLVESLALSLSGFAMLLKKPWALAALGVTLLGIALEGLLAEASGYATYGFERATRGSDVVLLLVGFALLVVFKRGRRSRAAAVVESGDARD